jgi:hypothetical protein
MSQMRGIMAQTPQAEIASRPQMGRHHEVARGLGRIYTFQGCGS